MGIFHPHLYSLDLTPLLLSQVTRQDVIDAYAAKLDAEDHDRKQGRDGASELTLEARCIHDTLELNYQANQVP